MHKNTIRAAALLLVVATMGATLGSAHAGREEIVRFTDGRYMQVQDHEIDGTWIRFELAADDWVIVPLRQVDAIKRTGSNRVVYRADRPVEDDRIGQAYARQRERAAMTPAERKTEAYRAALAARRSDGPVAALGDVQREWSERFPFERQLTMRPSMPVRQVMERSELEAATSPRRLAGKVWIGQLSWRPELRPVDARK